jgi:hypothetical protein
MALTGKIHLPFFIRVCSLMETVRRSYEIYLARKGTPLVYQTVSTLTPLASGNFTLKGDGGYINVSLD